VPVKLDTPYSSSVPSEMINGVKKQTRNGPPNTLSVRLLNWSVLYSLPVLFAGEEDVFHIRLSLEGPIKGGTLREKEDKE